MTILEKLDEMQARCDKATPGPWRADWKGTNHFELTSASSPYWLVRPEQGFERGEDLEFVAHSRTDLPRLLAALRVAVDGLASCCVNRIGGKEQLCGHCYSCKAIANVERALRGEE